MGDSLDKPEGPSNPGPGCAVGLPSKLNIASSDLGRSRRNIMHQRLTLLWQYPFHISRQPVSSVPHTTARPSHFSVWCTASRSVSRLRTLRVICFKFEHHNQLWKEVAVLPNLVVCPSTVTRTVLSKARMGSNVTNAFLPHATTTPSSSWSG